MRDSPTQDVLAVIPARGGSKRIPAKNIRPLLGRPLIAYTIEAARASGLFAQVVVSTDCPRTAEIARRHGAHVPFLRSGELSDDHAPISLATLDCLQRLDPTGQRFAHVAQLMANCPLRTAETIRDTWQHYQTREAEAQISVARFGWQNPWWAMTRDAAARPAPLFAQQLTARSQDLPPLYCPTGAVWWAESQALREHQTFYTGRHIICEIPWVEAIDIDDEGDWQLAEFTMRSRSLAA